jgi:hypothetical protein
VSVDLFMPKRHRRPVGAHCSTARHVDPGARNDRPAAADVLLAIAALRARARMKQAAAVVGAALLNWLCAMLQAHTIDAQGGMPDSAVKNLIYIVDSAVNKPAGRLRSGPAAPSLVRAK